MKINFKDLQAKLLEHTHHYLAEFQQSQLYIRTREWYDNLPYRTQKLLKGGIILFPLLFLLQLPIKPFINSFAYQNEIQKHQFLLRKLQEIKKKQSQQKKETPPPPLTQLQSNARKILENANLLNQQIEGVHSIQSFITLAPQLTGKGTVQVSLRKINLNQLLSFSQKFQFIHPGIFIHDMQVEWNKEQQGYLDAVFYLTTLKQK